MTLRLRLLISIGLTLAGLLAGIHVLSQRVMLRSFEDLERTGARRDVERASNTLDQMVDELHVFTADWSNWNDTYEFMADRNAAYIKSNLSQESLASTKIDLMLWVSESQREHHRMVVARSSALAAPNADAMLKYLREHGVFARAKGHGDGVKGIVLQVAAPMLVSVRPVHDTDLKAPRRGWIVFARYLDESIVSRLREMTQLSVEVFPVGRSQTPADVSSATHGRQSGQRYVEGASDAKTITGYAVADDIGGREALVLRVTEPRSIYLQGVASVGYLSKLILLVGIVFAAVVMGVIERFALLRLTSLGSQVEEIGASGRSGRVALSGRDELGRLANTINGMLESLERAEALRESEARLRLHNESLEQLVGQRTQQLAEKNSALENAVEGISRVDASGRIVEANAAFARSIGYEPEELIGEAWTVAIADGDRSAAAEALRRARQHGKSDAEVEARRRDGDTIFAAITIVADSGTEEPSTGFHLFLKDVSERKRMEREIERLAFHDKLTGLPNRALFLDRTAFALAKASRHLLGTAMLFLDLDNFKFVNDSLGHDAGDRLLQQVAERLTSAVRPGDTVARLGGDEFTVLLEDLESEREAEDVAARILEALVPAVSLGVGDAYVSASIGIAFAATKETSPKGLLKDADTAMYHAKAKGKSCCVRFEESMNDSATERMELETALRTALARDELFLEYQPLVDLQTGHVSGAEALARWRHSTRGVIAPARFIPIAEDTGLIVPIGYWVIEEACRQMRRWREESGLSHLTISVNLSGRQLERPDVVDRVREAVERSGLEPRFLVLEITETILMRDPETVAAKLAELKALGIGIALDDFGTGYSSLSTLSAFPIDTLKIDRAFISRLEDEAGAISVVQAIVALSRSLSMGVTGEGVETGFQMRAIRALGCDTGQGYLFARPLSGEEFDRFLEPASRRALAKSLLERDDRDLLRAA
ncbi:MAG: EAL domain-containing protein [Fimbriimonadaceae bacterium]|nr:EAL domain-containing protein [Fimbriimonadaceae bacterium]